MAAIWYRAIEQAAKDGLIVAPVDVGIKDEFKA